MTERVAELFNAAKVRFDHYGVKTDEKVLILADSGTYEPMLDAVYRAAVSTGADVTLLKMKAREQPWNWEMPPLLEHAIYNADFTFTLLSGRWFYNVSSERVRGVMRTTGKRMGGWGGTKAAMGHFLALLPGDPELVERGKRMAKLLYEVKLIRITSRLGTNLIMERGDPQKQMMNNSPGQVNYSPLGRESRLAIAKGEHPRTHEVVQGTLMFKGAYRTRCPGPEGHGSLVHKPVHIEIDRGRIVHISRDTEHGVFLYDWFHSWEDPTVYYFDHLNIGLDHRIRLEYLDNLAVHHNYGGLLMGFGISFSSNRGDIGVFRPKGHIELQNTGCTVYFDGRPIMVDGEFTRESGLRAHNRRPGTGAPWQEVEGHVLPKPPKF